MSEEKKQEYLDKLKDALADVPQKYRGEVCASLNHDIGIIKRTINMVENQPDAEKPDSNPINT